MSAGRRCPKCQRWIAPEGEGIAEGQHFLIYQCPECVEYFDRDGDVYEVPLTFAVGASGEVVRMDDPGPAGEL